MTHHNQAAKSLQEFEGFGGAVPKMHGFGGASPVVQRARERSPLVCSGRDGRTLQGARGFGTAVLQGARILGVQPYGVQGRRGGCSPTGKCKISILKIVNKVVVKWSVT